jgi:hypothetical protein
MGTGRSMAEAFGAKIKITMPDRALYLVIGHSESPASLVLTLNGQIVFKVPERPALLALLPIPAYFELKQHRSIAHIGAVSVDSERFNHFLEMLGLNNNHRNGGEPDNT